MGADWNHLSEMIPISSLKMSLGAKMTKIYENISIDLSLSGPSYTGFQIRECN